MKISYDPEADAAYLYLVDVIELGSAVRTVTVDTDEIDGMINIDFSTDGKVLGIEFLDASKKLPADLLCDMPSDKFSYKELQANWESERKNK